MYIRICNLPEEYQRIKLLHFNDTAGCLYICVCVRYDLYIYTHQRWPLYPRLETVIWIVNPDRKTKASAIMVVYENLTFLVL